MVKSIASGSRAERTTCTPSIRPEPPNESLMPPVLQIDKGAAFELHLHNHLTTVEAVAADRPSSRPGPDPTNVHTHGLVVLPTGFGFGTQQPRVGVEAFPQRFGEAFVPQPVQRICCTARSSWTASVCAPLRSVRTW